MQPLHQLGNLSGYHLQANNGEFGKVRQVYFDDEKWIVRYFVVRTGSWLLGREVLIIPSVVTSVTETEQPLTVSLTREQIKNSPPVDTKVPVSRHYEQEYHAYYGWAPYWSSEPAVGPVPTIPPPVTDRKPAEPEHPHLRSSTEVHGYRIMAKDGEIGHVADFILDERSWEIRYLVIDSGNWFTGHKVLVSPRWLLDIDWAQRAVKVNLTKNQIKKAPEYDPDKPISSEYERNLFKNYGFNLGNKSGSK